MHTKEKITVYKRLETTKLELQSLHYNYCTNYCKILIFNCFLYNCENDTAIFALNVAILYGKKARSHTSSSFMMRTQSLRMLVGAPRSFVKAFRVLYLNGGPAT